MITSPAPSLQQCHRAGDGTAGVDHVVNQDTGAPGHVMTVLDTTWLGTRRIAVLWMKGENHLRLGDVPAGGDDHLVPSKTVVSDVTSQQVPDRTMIDRPSKKPWIWSVCRSTVTIRSAPAVAGRRPVAQGGSRPRCFLPGIRMERHDGGVWLTRRS